MDGRWILHFDGLCEDRNPGGWMCWGWTLEREGLTTLTGKGFTPPHKDCTNNVAEYMACGFGIREALILKKRGDYYPGLTIHGDSQLVINQLNRQWQCNKEHLAKLRDRCLVLLNELGQWEASWISRDLNDAADALSRQAYFEATGHMPPERIKQEKARRIA